jgi:glycosyltransferase involved in cell wall biosynthesis
LVRAFDELAGSHPDLELVVAGPPGWDEERLAEAVRASPYRDRIRRLGWVADAASLLAGAQVFVYPSLYEGFGLPPLEAMALGVPVVATSAGAVPEVVGDAAVLVAPGDPAALAGAVERLLSDGAARAELVAAGVRRAGRFTWEACAEGLAGAYHEVAR